MATYMLLLRNTDEGNAAFASYTPEQIQQTMGDMMQRFFAWNDQLRGKGQLLDGHQLADGGAVVRSRSGQIAVDGPYTETKEGIGGTYLIEAANLDEATEIAKGCPALLYGNVVEVREVILTPDAQS